MGKIKLPANVTRTLGNIGLGLKKHAPEILMVTGVVGTVAATVMACKASTKVEAIIDKTKKKIDIINDCEAHPENLPEPYTKEVAKKDRLIVYTHTGMDLVKLYGPSVALGVASITCILASNNILRKRSAAIAAAYTTIDNGFKEYRQRVVDRFGEEMDKELKYNIKAKEVEEVVVDEKGEEQVVKTTVQTAEINKYSDYARFFDESCYGYSKSPEYNLMFLKRQQNWANDLLQAKGHLFLNDVYEMLGMEKTQAGQEIGWLYSTNPKSPHYNTYIDFGIYDPKNKSARLFVNGLERVCLVDFNVTGNIMHTLQK